MRSCVEIVELSCLLRESVMFNQIFLLEMGTQSGKMKLVRGKRSQRGGAYELKLCELVYLQVLQCELIAIAKQKLKQGDAKMKARK